MPCFINREAREVEKVLAFGWVAQAPTVAKFEQAVADYEKVAYGVATTPCTSALHFAMVANGMKAGMDVLASAFTFVATTNAIIETGANGKVRMIIYTCKIRCFCVYYNRFREM